MLKLPASLAIAMLLAGCASQSMLPESSSTVDFKASEGKVGWSSYRETATFADVSEDQVYEAAKVALGESGFALRSADRNARRVTGEHGITWHDWNVIAGIYYKPAGRNIDVLVQVEGSKDTGVSGDVTGSGWTGKILNAMRARLNR
ncbi:hypothetical protein LAZ40_05675 [Cereibacter sphaeroides]|uniref:hypothetical protein n=1 Tax=Cereibacter sphaeroides TaxID=1063 RepID=UPI001F367288|nr:hypothetical protein [Cereibacter sphaeroides]MCE6958539.1 hypothetical protein [Cereibacter sphaeroides]MCE6972798.1 hypothetical protein [Cereibacter sphaeroides]